MCWTFKINIILCLILKLSPLSSVYTTNRIKGGVHMLFGFSLIAIYMTILIVIGSCTLLYLFFGDLADGAAEGIPFFDPAVLLSFITMTAAGGYLLEQF